MGRARASPWEKFKHHAFITCTLKGPPGVGPVGLERNVTGFFFSAPSCPAFSPPRTPPSSVFQAFFCPPVTAVRLDARLLLYRLRSLDRGSGPFSPPRAFFFCRPRAPFPAPALLTCPLVSGLRVAITVFAVSGPWAVLGFSRPERAHRPGLAALKGSHRPPHPVLL